MFCKTYEIGLRESCAFSFLLPLLGTNTFNTAENDNVTKVWPNSLREKDIALYGPLNKAVSVKLEFTSLIKKHVDLSRNLENLGLLINLSMNWQTRYYVQA